jgi:hypothetical protein
LVDVGEEESPCEEAWRDYPESFGRFKRVRSFGSKAVVPTVSCGYMRVVLKARLGLLNCWNLWNLYLLYWLYWLYQLYRL